MVFGTVAAFVCAFAVADAGYLHIQCRLLHIMMKRSALSRTIFTISVTQKRK